MDLAAFSDGRVGFVQYFVRCEPAGPCECSALVQLCSAVRPGPGQSSRVCSRLEEMAILPLNMFEDTL
eukprot:3044492-Alexandrium_andersonii.AAC.1